MNTIVLMAGDAKRFENSSYHDIKPLINVKGKSIVRWTTDSLYPWDLDKLTFAIREDHDIKFNIKNRLLNDYGTNISFVTFKSLTRGNLETAYFTVQTLKDKDDSLLILDSDNKYNGSNFFSFLSGISSKEFATICYFEPNNDSIKWCFAVPDDDKIIKLSEKDEETLINGGKPMVGVFFFSSAHLFLDAARAVLGNGETCKNEFYMSQSINHLLNINIPVFGYLVDEVTPLGTPEDVKFFENAK